MKQLRKIGVLSAAKVFLKFGLVLGVLSGINAYLVTKQAVAQTPEIASMSFTDPSIAGNGQMMALLFTVKLGFWVILFNPIVTAALMWLSGIIFAGIYNLIAKHIGGIKLEID